MVGWPRTREHLEDLQHRLATMEAEPWRPPRPRARGRGRFRGVLHSGRSVAVRACVGIGRRGTRASTIVADAGAPYEPGYLALREGPALERAVRALERRPDVLLVDATGRDHPRGAGLALHLGAVLEVPTVGVTDRALLARIDEGRLLLGGREVGRVVVTRAGARPVFVHAAWRTDVDSAVAAVLAAGDRARTPEPLRRARFPRAIVAGPGRGTAPARLADGRAVGAGARRTVTRVSRVRAAA